MPALRFEKGLTEMINFREIKIFFFTWDSNIVKVVQKRRSKQFSKKRKWLNHMQHRMNLLFFQLTRTRIFDLKAGQHKVAALTAIHKILEDKKPPLDEKVRISLFYIMKPSEWLFSFFVQYIIQGHANHLSSFSDINGHVMYMTMIRPMMLYWQLSEQTDMKNRNWPPMGTSFLGYFQFNTECSI